MTERADLEAIQLRRELDTIARETIEAKARADYWKRIALEDRLAENERRARLGIKPLPLPPCLND